MALRILLYHHGIEDIAVPPWHCLSLRVFAPKCAACQKNIVPELVSTVIVIQRQGGVGRGEGVHGEGISGGCVGRGEGV